MAKWRTSTRVEDLIEKYLPTRGAIWRGTVPEFVEFLMQLIPQMPEPVSSVMQRHYIEGDTQRMNEFGRPDKDDQRYYQILMTGKDAVVMRIREAQSEPRISKLLERVYGN